MDFVDFSITVYCVFEIWVLYRLVLMWRRFWKDLQHFLRRLIHFEFVIETILLERIITANMIRLECVFFSIKLLCFYFLFSFLPKLFNMAFELFNKIDQLVVLSQWIEWSSLCNLSTSWTLYNERMNLFILIYCSFWSIQIFTLLTH